MKKILILLVVTICFCGCGNTDIIKEEPTQNIIEKYYYKDSDEKLFTVEIEGHLYIIYKGFYKGGITHAEHCPCKNK